MHWLPETDDQGAEAGDPKHDIPKLVAEPRVEDNETMSSKCQTFGCPPAEPHRR
jgi:hypothetical protein